MKSSFKRKGGQAAVLGLLFIGIAVVFVALSFIFLSFIVGEFTDVVVLQNDTSANPTFSNSTIEFLQKTDSSLPQVLDASFAFFVVMSGVMLVAVVALVPGNIIFFGVSIASFIFVVLGNAILANVIDKVGNTAIFSATYASMPMMSFLASNWLVYSVVIGFVSIIAFFAGSKLRGVT